MKTFTVVGIIFLMGWLSPSMAQDRVELESIYIKGNKEFPQILYIVPWKDMKPKGHQEQTLVLHSFFGDLFDPVYGELGQTTEVPAQNKKSKRK